MTAVSNAPACGRLKHRRQQRLILPLEPHERWWGGAVDDGIAMPFGTQHHHRDLAGPPHTGAMIAAPSNQSAPILLSTTGRTVWSDAPFSFTFDDNTLTVEGEDITVDRMGSTLREAYLAASRRHFPPSSSTPALELFTGPQYNTWIDQPYQPTQESVLQYVRALLDSGLPPGVVIIDDSWAPDYGQWRFDPARFPDPAAMTAQLHAWGCSVMLWLVPFVSPDSATFRHLEEHKLLILDGTGNTAVRRWWNGISALLDVTNNDAIAWLTDQLDTLIRDFGIDGFKFDGGDVRDYRTDDINAALASPVEMCEAWAQLGLRYPFNEYRACWRMGGQPIGQRLQDKPPRWGAEGIETLIPEVLAQGMIGHPFSCPDMIGGGEITAMLDQSTIDQEFFVRYCQVAAVSPMMQFSAAPQQVLDAQHLDAVNEALKIREELLPVIMQLVETAAVSGEPILRPMAYHASDCEDVNDQFFLGADLIVAPVLRQGATTRTVRLPAGQWRADDNTMFEGPANVSVDVNLRRIPRFARIAQDHG